MKKGCNQRYNLRVKMSSLRVSGLSKIHYGHVVEDDDSARHIVTDFLRNSDFEGGEPCVKMGLAIAMWLINEENMKMSGSSSINTIEEGYILMAEPYHNFVNLLPNLARGEFPAGFPFFNIKPEENEKILRFYYPKESRPDPIGNSPVIIRKDLLEKITPTWMNVSLRMKDGLETNITFGCMNVSLRMKDGLSGPYTPTGITVVLGRIKVKKVITFLYALPSDTLQHINVKIDFEVRLDKADMHWNTFQCSLDFPKEPVGVKQEEVRIVKKRKKARNEEKLFVPNTGARETAAVLETTLLQALLLTGQSTTALDLLKSLNYCDVKICEEILLNGNHYLCLSELYKCNSLHREALKLLHHIEVADVNVLIVDRWLGVQAV
ncbi:hydroxyproline O-arabinosyltransferase 3 [Tanacetum coccineum]